MSIDSIVEYVSSGVSIGLLFGLCSWLLGLGFRYFKKMLKLGG